MGIFNRLSDLLNANINDLIDKAENPVSMVRQMVREVDDAIIRHRAELRQRSSHLNRAQRRLEKKRAEAAQWQSRAEVAVDEGNDETARRALARKHELEQEEKALEAAWWESEKNRDVLREELDKLENRAQELRRRKESLIVKRQRNAPSSDFIAIPAKDSQEEKKFKQMSLDDELEALKRKREENKGS